MKKKMKLNKGKKSGFTLIEIMIVLTILSLIMGLVGVSLFKRLDEGKIKTVQIQMIQIEQALELFKLNNHRYPNEEIGLQELIYPEKGYPLMDKIPKDPWGEEYIYSYEKDKGKKPVIISKGPDKKISGDDIISTLIAN